MRTQSWFLTPANVILVSIMMQKNVLYRIQSALTHPSIPLPVDTHTYKVMHLGDIEKPRHEGGGVRTGPELCVDQLSQPSPQTSQWNWNVYKPVVTVGEGRRCVEA